MYPKEYIEYLAFFHGPRDYFECHEVLEEYWKENNQQRNSIWVGLIQVAVALYHQRNGNLAGASRILAKAITNLKTNKEKIEEYGLEGDKLISILNKRHKEIKNGATYYSINIPIKDPTLLDDCHNTCKEMGYEWGKSSDLSNEFIVNKHRLRDRSEVINERDKQKKLRKNSK